MYTVVPLLKDTLAKGHLSNEDKLFVEGVFLLEED